MRKLVLLLLIFTILLPATVHYGEEAPVPAGVSTSAYLLDDCAGLDKIFSCSEGIYPSVIEAENQYAFDEDFTVFMRKEATAEWITYSIPEQKYLTFYTYFRQGEPISHFTFEASEDGESWETIRPIIQKREVESWKWIPVTYSLKKMEERFHYVKITFQNIGGTEWSPCISSVDAQYRKITGIGFADCNNTPYQEATERLKNLKLINGYSDQEFAPENPITRAEFTKMISSLLNITNLSSGTRDTHYFRDIPDTHWAAPYIYTMYGLGIVNGDEKQRFHPEAQITLQDAVKILVAALGYDIQAAEKGGYPMGYIQTASQLSILQNITNSYTETINRGIAALLIDNSLDVPYIYQTKFGEQNIFQYDGSSVLEKLHGIYTAEGIISSIGIRSIYAEHTIDENYLSIDDVLYEKPSFDMTDYLGVQTKIYYHTKRGQNNNRKVLYAEKKHAETLTIAAKDILHYSAGKLVYQNAAGREVTKGFHSETRVLYNGRYYSRIGLMTELPLTNGTLTIILNGADRTQDILRIVDYQTYLSQTKSRLTDGIQDRYLGLQKFDFDTALELRLFIDGEEISYEDSFTVEQDSVVQIAQSKDKLCTEIQISNTMFSAQITSVHQQEGRAVIEGKEYLLSPYYKRHHSESIRPGTYKIYLDMNQHIIDLSDNFNTYQYGYLLGIAASPPFYSDAIMRIATASGIEVYSVNNRTKYNDAKVDFQTITQLQPQLIRFKSREDGSITGFYIAKEAHAIDENAFTLNYRADSSKYYGENLKVFSSIYQLDQETKIFFIPNDLKHTDEIKVGTCDSLYTDYSYHVALYDLNRSYIAGAAVIYEDGSTKRQVASYDPVMLIDEAVSAQNDKEEPILILRGYVAGEYTELIFPNDGAEDLTSTWLPNSAPRITENGNPAFRRGEILQYYTKNGTCKSFRLLLTQPMRDTDTFYEKNLGDYGNLTPERYYSEMYTAYGLVTEKFSDKLFLSADGGMSKRTISYTDAAFLLYDQRQDKIYSASAVDVASGDRIFTRLYYTGTKEIIIIK